MIKFDIFDGYRTKGLKQFDQEESLFDEIFSISEDPLCQFGNIVNGVIFNYPNTNTYLIVFAWMTSVGSLSQAISVGNPHPSWLLSLLGDSKSAGLVFGSEIVQREKEKGATAISNAIAKLTPKPFYVWRSEVTDYQKSRELQSDHFRGIVAYGAKLQVSLDAYVWCVFWLTPPFLLEIFNSEQDCLRIHGHFDESKGTLRNQIFYGFPDRSQTLIPNS